MVEKRLLIKILVRKIWEQKGLDITHETPQRIEIIDEGEEMAVFTLFVNEGLNLGINYNKDAEVIEKVFGYDPHGFSINSKYLFAL